MNTYEVTTTAEKFRIDADGCGGHPIIDNGPEAVTFMRDGKSVAVVMASALISVVRLKQQ